MATGLKIQPSLLNQTISPMDKYGIALADMQNLTYCVDIVTAGSSNVIAAYKGTSAITLANYNGFPTGTIIFDLQAHKTHEKTGATTWVSSVARA